MGGLRGMLNKHTRVEDWQNTPKLKRANRVDRSAHSDKQVQEGNPAVKRLTQYRIASVAHAR